MINLERIRPVTRKGFLNSEVKLLNSSVIIVMTLPPALNNSVMLRYDSVLENYIDVGLQSGRRIIKYNTRHGDKLLWPAVKKESFREIFAFIQITNFNWSPESIKKLECKPSFIRN